MMAAYIARSFWASSISLIKPLADDALDINTTPSRISPVLLSFPCRQFSHHRRNMSTTLLSLIIGGRTRRIIAAARHIGEFIVLATVIGGCLIEALEPRLCLSAP